MDLRLSPKEQTLLKKLVTKHAYEVAKLKKSGIDGYANVNDGYFESRLFLNALLVLEMQEKMQATIEECILEYEDIMGEETMLYVVASTGLQYFAGMATVLVESRPALVEVLLDEVMLHYEDICEEMGLLEAMTASEIEEPAGTPAEQLKANLTLVKGSKDDE